MISVVIPTLNRCHLLEKTLQSISVQDFPADSFEVLIIDNGSTDATKTVANASGIRNVRYIFEPNPGLHAGRHRGMAEAKHDILVYADDDIVALPTWLSAIDNSFRDPEVAIVGGNDFPLYESDPPQWIEELWVRNEHGRFLTFYSLLEFGKTRKEIDPVYVFGCNFSIRKEILMKVKGFHPDGMPSDRLRFRGDGETYVAEMVRSLGYKTIFDPGASVNHWVPTARMNEQYLLKRSFAEGVTQSYSDIRSGKHAKNSHLKNMLRPLAHWLREIVQDPLTKKIRRSFREGYAFHQHEVEKDPDLLKWVLREHYLDA